MITNLLQRFIKDQEQNYLTLVDKMITVNPLNLLRKGYTLTYQDQQLVTSLDKLDLEKELEIRYHDGGLVTKPLEKKKLGEYDV
jgi:exodeoxyribonuclease VII large subunit